MRANGRAFVSAVASVRPLEALDHRELAICWALWNGQIGTAKQTDRIMRQLSSADLVRMLADRGVKGLERRS